MVSALSIHFDQLKCVDYSADMMTHHEYSHILEVFGILILSSNRFNIDIFSVLANVSGNILFGGEF